MNEPTAIIQAVEKIGRVILEAGGGHVTYPSGEAIFSLLPDSPAYRGESVPFLATNGRIHEQCVDKLAQIE